MHSSFIVFVKVGHSITHLFLKLYKYTFVSAPSSKQLFTHFFSFSNNIFLTYSFPSTINLSGHEFNPHL